MNITEFRVRPVTRFIVTKYESDDLALTASSSVVGEFPTMDAAESVGKAMQIATPMSVYVEPVQGQQIGGPRPDSFSLGAQMRNEALFAKAGDYIDPRNGG